MLEAKDLRVVVDGAGESVGYRIRRSEKMKVPYMLVIGDNEASLEELNVRIRGEADEVKMSVEDFINRVSTAVKERKFTN